MGLVCRVYRVYRLYRLYLFGFVGLIGLIGLRVSDERGFTYVTSEKGVAAVVVDAFTGA